MRNLQNEKQMDDLFNAILKLETVDECYELFEDLCTVLEIKSLAQRFQVAKMLAGKHVYSDIVAETGASTATISRVNRCINYGSGGYSMIFKRLKDDEEKNNQNK